MPVTPPKRLSSTTLIGIAAVVILLILAVYRGLNPVLDPKSRFLKATENVKKQCDKIVPRVRDVDAELNAIAELVKPYADGKGTETFTRQAELTLIMNNLSLKSDALDNEINKLDQATQSFSAATDIYLNQAARSQASREFILKGKNDVIKGVQSILNSNAARRQQIVLLRSLTNALNTVTARQLYIATENLRNENKKLAAMASAIAPAGFMN